MAESPTELLKRFGITATVTVEGRERFPVRIRYQRERRDVLEEMERILVPTAMGAQIPLAELAEFHLVAGPQMIRSEDTRLTSYVLFDRRPGIAETDPPATGGDSDEANR